jgi:TonB family protein
VDVADVLRDRVGEPDGFQRMAVISLLVHAAVFAMLVLAPGNLLSRREEAPKTVMTITLDGGNGGPNNGGMTSIGGKAVQAETPEVPKARPPQTAPAPVTPKMTVPMPSKTPAKPAKATPEVKQAPDQAKGRAPTKGFETREGSALAETGARGLGFGLSTSGGVGSGSTLDVQNFCCPDYVGQMVEQIRANWDGRAEVSGLVIVKYKIQRDGTITDATIEKPSGYTVLDISALRAVANTRKLLPLPAAFPDQTLGVHLHFEYRR